MRLFLSSEDLGRYPEVLVELAGENTKAALINNAKDGWTAEDRQDKTEEKKQLFRQLGFDVHELDLRAYFGKEAELEKSLRGVGLVWAGGGNTFILRRAMAQSGLDKLLKKRVADDSIVYGGSSAGAIIATPSLQGVELGDDPKDVPDGYQPEIIWGGLNFVDFHIIPHHESDWFGKEASDMENYLKARKMPYRALKDGQVIIIDNDKKEFFA